MIGEVQVDDSGPVWVVRLNRPDKANALTEPMLIELATIAERAHQARALVLTGEGRVFSAGADLDAARAGLATSPLWERLSGALAAAPCLTIAALNGTVAGGAMGMVLACDLRLAVPEAKVFYPVMKLGFLPQPSDPQRLSALVGPAKSKMILMAGQKIPAPEALTWGLIDRLTTDPLSDALDLTRDCSAATPAHVKQIKAMIP